MEGLRIPQVSTYAAHALREMCDKCKKEMTPNFDGLLEVCTVYCKSFEMEKFRGYKTKL